MATATWSPNLQPLLAPPHRPNPNLKVVHPRTAATSTDSARLLHERQLFPPSSTKRQRARVVNGSASKADVFGRTGSNPVVVGTGKHALIKLLPQALWRNGSAFDSRSKGYPFKSGQGQVLSFCGSSTVLGVEAGGDCGGWDGRDG
jgi:hypothetical protein